MKKKSILFLLLAVFSFLNFNDVISQWSQTSNGMGNNKTVISFDSLGNNFFAGTYDAGVYVSSNNGANWTQTSLIATQINALASNGSIIFAGAEDIGGTGGVYVSSNNGTNWTKTAAGYRVFSIACKDGFTIAGTYASSGIILSSNNGANWVTTSLTTGGVLAIKTMGTRIFAGVSNTGSSTSNGVYISTNNGANWTLSSLSNRVVTSFTVSGSNIFAGTQEGGVYLSTDNGTTWSQTTSIGGNSVNALSSIGSNIFAGVYVSGFYHSSNNGLSWTQKNEGFTVGTTQTYIYALTIKNNSIFAGTLNNSVWLRSLSTVVSNIRQISSLSPAAFLLNQNYPNPFNPQTKINFSIPKISNTVLKVFNTNGTEVQTLVNQNLQAGTYSVEFGNANLTSGIYFYTLTSGEFKETKKMILVK